MRKLYLVPALFLMVSGCGDSSVAPAEGALFFEGVVTDVDTDMTVMTFNGSRFGHGWGFAPDPDRPSIPVPEDVSSTFFLNTGTQPSEDDFVEVRVDTHGIPVPPTPGRMNAAKVDDPTDPEHHGVITGHFRIADDFFSPRTSYEVVEGHVEFVHIPVDGPATGTLVLIGEAIEGEEDRPARVRLEGSFRTHKNHAAVCTLVDPDCKES